MNTTLLLVIGGVVIVAIALIVILVVARNRRIKRLRDAFGPEYEKMVMEKGRKAAHVELENRLKKIKSLEIHPLSVADRDQYLKDWISAQAEFVEEPCKAISEADRLITEVMQRRGYPVEGFEGRVADLSVKEPRLVGDYRSAHESALDKEDHIPDTEQVRQSMLCYKDVFKGLLVAEKI